MRNTFSINDLSGGYSSADGPDQGLISSLKTRIKLLTDEKNQNIAETNDLDKKVKMSDGLQGGYCVNNRFHVWFDKSSNPYCNVESTGLYSNATIKIENNKTRLNQLKSLIASTQLQLDTLIPPVVVPTNVPVVASAAVMPTMVEDNSKKMKIAGVVLGVGLLCVVLYSAAK